MSKMSVSDAAEHFGVSREAIHNRVRRGSLQSIIEDGVKLVVIDSSSSKRAAPRASASTATLSDDKYYKLLEEQNSKLQSRVDLLEGETRTLRDQKELMLIEERIKIENIYKEKDEQLKNILASISSKFMLGAPDQFEKEEHVEAEIEVLEQAPREGKLVSLKKYIKEKNLSEKKIKKIKEKFSRIAKSDERILKVGGKLYLDFSKHDYGDLF